MSDANSLQESGPAHAGRHSVQKISAQRREACRRRTAEKRGIRRRSPFITVRRTTPPYSAEAGKYFMYCTRWAMADVSSPNFRRPRNSSSDVKPWRAAHASRYSFMRATVS